MPESPDFDHVREVPIVDLGRFPRGVPGQGTTRTYLVSLPWWARRIRRAAEAIVTWTRRFERHTRIG